MNRRQLGQWDWSPNVSDPTCCTAGWGQHKAASNTRPQILTNLADEYQGKVRWLRKRSKCHLQTVIASGRFFLKTDCQERVWTALQHSKHTRLVLNPSALTPFHDKTGGSGNFKNSAQWSQSWGRPRCLAHTAYSRSESSKTGSHLRLCHGSGPWGHSTANLHNTIRSGEPNCIRLLGWVQCKTNKILYCSKSFSLEKQCTRYSEIPVLNKMLKTSAK